MSQYTLPFLFINLSGEMIYILDQRLRAQNVAVEKAKKVLDDIISITFNPRFMEELFKPQEIYNKGALKSLFHDLAHASIMRLNEVSMNKLYDLMIMVFKWQVSMASHPKELILITLNHLDQIRLLTTSKSIQKQLDAAYFMFIKTYGQMSCGQLQRIRYSILNFLQDIRVRVSLLLRQGLQNPDGSFLINVNQQQLFYGCEIPGKIRIYSKDGIPIDLISFNPGGVYVTANFQGSTDLRGIRHTPLGTNMYENHYYKNYSSPKTVIEKTEQVCEEDDRYKKEINLLVTQLGANNLKLPDDSFPLQLFDLQDEGQESNSQAVQSTENETNQTIIEEPVENPHKEVLNKILEEMPTMPKDHSEFDLLDLMDELS